MLLFEGTEATRIGDGARGEPTLSTPHGSLVAWLLTSSQIMSTALISG
jgi:hypothetical protein